MAWSLYNAVAAQHSSQLFDVNSSVVSASSSPSPPPRRTPRYTAETYFWIIVGTEIIIYTVVALVIQRLPMRLFTRLASQVFGFELSQALYRRSHPRDQDQEIGNKSDDRPDDDICELDVYLHTRPSSIWVMGKEIEFNEAVLNAEEEAYANKPLTKWCWLHGLNSIRTGFCCRRGCLKARPGSVEYRIRNSIQQLIHWSVYVSLALLIFLVVLGNTRYSVDKTDRMCPPEIMQSGAGQWDCFLFAASSGFYVTSWNQYINCDEPIPAELDLSSASLACFRLYSPTTDKILQSLSAVASLFSIVFGGSTAVFGWLLANMRTERKVTWMYVVPVGITFTYLILMLFNLLHTSLAIVAPLAAIALSVFMIRIRMAVGFEAKLEQEVTLESTQQITHGDDPNGNTADAITKNKMSNTSGSSGCQSNTSGFSATVVPAHLLNIDQGHLVPAILASDEAPHLE